MKTVESLDKARALALSKGAALREESGKSFNSGRDKFNVIKKDESEEPTTIELFQKIVEAIPEQDHEDIIESLAELKTAIDAIEINMPVGVETVIDLTEIIEHLENLEKINTQEDHSDITAAIERLDIPGIRDDIAKFTINDLREQLVLIRKELEVINLKMVEREEVWDFEIIRDSDKLMTRVIGRGVIR